MGQIQEVEEQASTSFEGPRKRKVKEGMMEVDIGDFYYKTPPSSELRYSYTQLHQHTNIQFQEATIICKIGLSILRRYVPASTQHHRIDNEITIDEQN
jgi:hypothetical protein